MRPRLVPLLASLALATTAFGAYTLDWGSASNWSLGSSTGSFNQLAGAGSATSSINTLTYNFGDGLTATVSLHLEGSFSEWQNGSGVYSDPLTATGYAPRYFTGGDVLALGVSGRSADKQIPAGATLTITFSSPISGLSFRIGDIDNGGQRDLVTLSGNVSGWAVTTSTTAAPMVTNNGTLVLTSTTAQEGVFGTNATTAWASLSSGNATVSTLSINLSALVGSGENASSNAHGIWLSDMSIAAIPEPSTYALLLGLATLGVAVWVKRRG